MRQMRSLVVIVLAAALFLPVRWSFLQAKIEDLALFDDEAVSISAVILRQELVSASKQRLLLRVMAADSTLLIGGRLQAVLPRFPEHQVGQTISGSCQLRRPVNEDKIAYASILAAKNIFLLCEEAKVEVIQERPFVSEHPFLWIRLKMLERINDLWPRPEASLVRGLLLGDRADFPQKVLDDFSTAGISHIIALSGFNIAVIFTSLEIVLLRFRLPRSGRVWLMLVIMTAFVVLVGAASSIVRAAAMGALAIVGRLFGRRPQAMRLLVISAAAMITANPYVLLYDAGFQLSCLATAGLLTLSDRFAHWCRWVPERFSLRSSLSTTLAASAPTLPLLMYQFERWSVVAPLTNMLVLPLIPWLMAISAVAAACSMLLPLRPIALLLAYVTMLGSDYILSVSSWFAALPFAASAITLSTTMLVTSLFLLCLWMIYETNRKKVR